MYVYVTGLAVWLPAFLSYRPLTLVFGLTDEKFLEGLALKQSSSPSFPLLFAQICRPFLSLPLNSICLPVCLSQSLSLTLSLVQTPSLTLYLQTLPPQGVCGFCL